MLGEELARCSAALASAFGIYYDCAALYLVDLTTEEQSSAGYRASAPAK